MARNHDKICMDVWTVPLIGYRIIFETSTLELLAESKLPLISEELLDRRRCRLVSAGSFGWRPLARAKRFRTSVRDTTPDKRPDILAPGSEEADTDGEAEAGMNDGVACGVEET